MCQAKGKHPRIKNWGEEATTDIAKITGWWNKTPLANIGIPMGEKSGLVALDVDTRHNGDKSLASLEEEYGKLPTTITATTGSGGKHYVFKYTEELAIKNAVGFRDGLDVRTQGGLTADDLGVAQDLLETLAAHKDGCVGMAANMIGVGKRIIAFESEGETMVMFNPVIVRQSGAYEAEEGCLSLTGTRKTKRFRTIKVQWQNEKFQTRLKTFTGWTAEIIQHEIDHCEGIII